MIHRINSVAPDLDDRVIKPNQARSAKNIRFGASSEDSNLSGGIGVNGITAVAFDPASFLPANLVAESYAVGTKIDYEGGYVFYAVYTEAIDPNNPSIIEYGHSIVRITTATGTGEFVVRGEWLNFQKYGNVSMVVVDGKLYWTDGVNEPRMVNIQKGIRTFNDGLTTGDIYPQPNAENLWCFSQYKRSPQNALFTSTTDNLFLPTGETTPYWFTTDLTSGYVNKTWLSQTPYQFSYYYIYDNNEESRLAPWSDVVYYVRNILVSIPNVELNLYCDPANKTIIKNIVIVCRKGNAGTVYSVKKWNVNEFVLNPTGGAAAFRPDLAIPSIDSISKTPVPADIYEQRYDSLPLLSKTNEMAGDILNHGNVVVDYNDFGDIKIVSTEIVKMDFRNVFESALAPVSARMEFFKTFQPSCNYNIGIQLIDEYGRCSPVLSTTTVTIPDATYVATATDAVSTFNNVFNAPINPTVFIDDIVNNQYQVKISVAGNVPPWVKYIRACYTKNNTTQFFNKTLAKLYYWYEDGTGDRIYIRTTSTKSSLQENNNNLQNVKKEGEPTKIYSFKGYAVEVDKTFPFLYNPDENQYIKIAREYWNPSDVNIPNTGLSSSYIEYKISGQDGKLFLIKELFTNINFYTGYYVFGQNLTNYQQILPFWYQVEFGVKKDVQEVVYYDTLAQCQIEDYRFFNNSFGFRLTGDCYMTYFKKKFDGQIENVRWYQDYSESEGFWYAKVNTNYVDPGWTVYGVFYATNLTNIYNETWDSAYGLENIAQTVSDKVVNLPYNIVFSNKFLRGTFINGLNKFNPLNIRQSPPENGPITSLITTTATQGEPGVLLSIGEFAVSSYYYNAVQLTNTDGSSNLVSTDQHLASQRPLLGQFGTKQPWSITKNTMGYVYWWSETVNDFIRYSNAGLERLGLTYAFGNKLRQDAVGKRVITGYDHIMDEAILIPQGGNAFVFSERYKTFQGYRSYNQNGITPERIVGISPYTFYFLKGKFYISTATSPFNSFFGTTHNPEVTIVTNEYPTVVKQWNSIKVFGPKPSATTLETGSAEGLPVTLTSTIASNWWIQRKGDYDAAIRRAIAPSGNGLSGKVMESRILYSTFVFDAGTFEKLNFIEIKSNIAITQ